MKLSTKARYGMRVMIDIAMMQHYEKPVQLSDIAKRQDLSEKYLEQIMAILKTHSLVRSIRGAQGGYLLSRRPDEINALEIVESLEGKLNLVECITDTDCCRDTTCASQKLWEKVSQSMQHLLNSVTLVKLVSWQKEECNVMDYII